MYSFYLWILLILNFLIKHLIIIFTTVTNSVTSVFCTVFKNVQSKSLTIDLFYDSNKISDSNIFDFLSKSDIYDDYQPYLFGLPLPASETMNALIDLYTEIYTLILCIFIVVFLILIDVVIRFRNIQYDVISGTSFYTYPKPFTSEEEHFIDVLVIIIPTWIILHILAPSLGYIYNEEIKFYDVSISFDVNIIGCQWYWTYEYIIEVCTDDSYSSWNPYYFNNEEENQIIFSFDSIINMENPDKRLLSVYEPLVLPVHTNILLSFTSRDVIHSWALPQMGIKVDCVPGRITHTMFCSYAMGVFYGQCSELCGIFHGFMPICVEIITFDHFFIWTLNNYFVFMSEQNTIIDPIFSKKVFLLLNKS